jgi:RNA polymerase sigma-70 factor (ECF subfamily)
MSTLNLGVASSMGGQRTAPPPDAVAEPPAASTPAAEQAWVAPSWDDIVRQHADRVYRLAYRLSGNRSDAEDLTQETFVRVFRSLADYTPGTFEGWLHRITTNLFLDMVRRRAAGLRRAGTGTGL